MSYAHDRIHAHILDALENELEEARYKRDDSLSVEGWEKWDGYVDGIKTAIEIVIKGER